MKTKATQWAERAYEKRPLEVYFERAPEPCRRNGCAGYHETVSLRVDQRGHVFVEPVLGFHATPTRTSPRQCGAGVEALARVAKGLLAWAREVDPWACYPDV